MAAAPRRRPIDPQPAHPDPGFREAERSGLGAAGTGNHRGDHRRVLVHGGQGRGPAPAKAGAAQFVTSLPPKFNIALVTFAGTATTLVPPTMDHGSVTAAIPSL